MNCDIVYCHKRKCVSFPVDRIIECRCYFFGKMLAKIIVCGQAFFMHVAICYVNQRIIGWLRDFSVVSDLYNNTYTNNTIMWVFFTFLKGIF